METGSLQSHLGETEIPVIETKLIRVCGSGYIYELGGAEYIKSVGPSLTFRFRTYVEMRKWLRVLEHITKHFYQASH